MCVKNSILIIVSLVQVLTVSFAHENKDKLTMVGKESNTLLRLKRQDSPWVWEAAEYLTTARSKNVRTPVSPTNVMMNGDDANPCDKPKSVKPNFSKPELRISEQKCYEYLWQIRDREEEDKKFKACLEYKRQHPDPDGAKFAIGGRNTKPGEFPHMGAIGWKAIVGTWVFKCGGSLISSKFVLTAAHCSKVSSRDTQLPTLCQKWAIPEGHYK